MLLCAAIPAEYEYVVPMHDSYMKGLVFVPQLRSVERRSNCHVIISPRVLNRRVTTDTWMKYNIIKVSGPNDFCVNKCNKLLERLNPNYLYRRKYNNAFIPTIFTNEFTPDNGNLYYDAQRLGANINNYNGLKLINRYKGDVRYPKTGRAMTTPWQTWTSHRQGIHYPEQKSTAKILAHIQPNLIRRRRPIAGILDRKDPAFNLLGLKNSALALGKGDSLSDNEEIVSEKTEDLLKHDYVMEKVEDVGNSKDGKMVEPTTRRSHGEKMEPRKTDSRKSIGFEKLGSAANKEHGHRPDLVSRKSHGDKSEIKKTESRKSIGFEKLGSVAKKERVNENQVNVHQQKQSFSNFSEFGKLVSPVDEESITDAKSLTE